MSLSLRCLTPGCDRIAITRGQCGACSYALSVRLKGMTQAQKLAERAKLVTAGLLLPDRRSPMGGDYMGIKELPAVGHCHKNADRSRL